MVKPSPKVAKWFSEALEDLRVRQGIYSWQNPSLKRCGFFAQQTVEKTLKGYLTFLGQHFPKTHDLGLLADLILKSDTSLRDVLAGVEQLTYCSRFGNTIPRCTTW